MKKIFSMLSFVWMATILFGQMPSDTVGIHCKGYIMAGDYKQIMVNRNYEDRTLVLIEKFPNSEKVHREFVRFDDKHFVYTEYYEKPVGDRYNTNYGKWREGLVYSSSIHSNDTLITFDPETFEENMYLYNYLIPVGHWQHFHSNGKLKFKGEYSRDGKEKEWTFYDQFGQLEKVETYEKNQRLMLKASNAIVKEDKQSTKEMLIGKWRFTDNEQYDTKVLNPKFRNRIFMSTPNGEQKNSTVFDLKSNGKIIRTDYYETKRESKGKWKLKDYKTLEISIGKEKRIYEIESLKLGKCRLLKK